MSLDCLSQTLTEELGLTREAKPASEYTCQVNSAVYSYLDFEDTSEYENAMRGLIDAPESLVITDDNGKAVWSQDAYAFLDDYETAPDTVNLLSGRTRKTTMHTDFLKSAKAFIRCAGMTWPI